MKAYVVVDINVEQPEAFMEYVGQIGDLISKHDGRYLVQGAEPETILGDNQVPQHSVILEFPSREIANSFFDERKKLGLHDLFCRATDSRILLVDGINETDGETA